MNYILSNKTIASLGIAGIVLLNGVVALAATPFTSDQLLESWGWALAQDTQLTQLALREPEIDSFIHGITAATQSRAATPGWQRAAPAIDDLLNERHTQGVERLSLKARQQTEDFFAKLKSSPDVIFTASGLAYTIVRPGNGDLPRPEQKVSIRLTGSLINGHIFDSTELTRGGRPLEFKLGNAMPGWVEGLSKIGEGGRIILYVPPALGCGERGAGAIPPNATLIFQIDLITIKSPAAEPATRPFSLFPTEPPATAPVSAEGPDETPPPSTAPTSQAAPSFTGEQLIEMWAWRWSQETRLTYLQLTASELRAVGRGIAAAMSDRPAPTDEAQIRPQIDPFLGQRQQQGLAALRHRGKQAADAMFAQVAKKPGVRFLPDGVACETLRAGTGPVAQPDQIMVLRYCIRLPDGSVIDDTTAPDTPPAQWRLDDMMAGCKSGLARARVGEKVRLYLPPQLAIGEDGIPGVPPNSALIFEAEILDIKFALQQNSLATP